MGIQDKTDEQLKNLVNNYKRLEKTEGGIYSLAEVHLEIQRRLGKAYNGRDAALKIVDLARQSDDGLVTFLDLWKSFYPEQEWVGHKSVREVMAILGGAAYYCAAFPGGPLPIVTAAVVQSSSRVVTRKAKENIFNAAKDWGLDTGSDIEDFYQSQLEGTKKLVASDLTE